MTYFLKAATDGGKPFFSCHSEALNLWPANARFARGNDKQKLVKPGHPLKAGQLGHSFLLSGSLSFCGVKDWTNFENWSNLIVNKPFYFTQINSPLYALYCLVPNECFIIINSLHDFYREEPVLFVIVEHLSYAKLAK